MHVNYSRFVLAALALAIFASVRGEARERVLEDCQVSRILKSDFLENILTADQENEVQILQDRTGFTIKLGREQFSTRNGDTIQFHPADREQNQFIEVIVPDQGDNDIYTILVGGDWSLYYRLYISTENKTGALVGSRLGRAEKPIARLDCRS